MDGYGVTHWPDADDILARLDRLVKQPMRPIRADRMAGYHRWFEEHCAKSKALNEQARQVIPGGVQHNLAFNHPFPLAIDRADGAYLWDVDGNRYIDFLQAGGPTVLGSNYGPVREKVLELLHACGPCTGLFHEYELKLAQFIHDHMPSIEMFRMLGSGTEATMAAIRAARAFTDKSKVIKVGGAYHGWSDQLVYALHIPGTGALEAVGIPRGCNKDTLEFFPNDLEALAALLDKNEDKGGTACVIVEPFGPESGTRPIRADFNHKVRDLCTAHGTLLIFDEVVTGFRVGLGGAQGYFGIRPDLTTFGKCIAGGYPAAGGLGGRRDVMSVLAAGVEAGKARAYVGGTLSANPLSCVAGYWSLVETKRTHACEKAGRAGDLLAAGIQGIFDRRGLPFVAWNQASIVHIETSGAMLIDINDGDAFEDAQARKRMMEQMGAAYTAEGLITIAGSRLYTSLADTDEVVAAALAGFEKVFASIEGV
jgi:glutamate-1-semialdehyde 2,1-aminomutase